MIFGRSGEVLAGRLCLFPGVVCTRAALLAVRFVVVVAVGMAGQGTR